PERDRISLIEVLGQCGKADCVPLLVQVLREAKSDGLRTAALSALQPFPEAKITDEVLAMYPKLSPSLRGRAQDLLCSRPASSVELLKAVDEGRIAAKEIPLKQVRRIWQYQDEGLTKLVEKHWGKIGPATAGEKLTRIRSISDTLRNGSGDVANGKMLFQKHC